MTYIDAYGSPADSVRQPRAWVEIGGARIMALSATVTRKAIRSADTFSADLSIDDAAQYGFGLAQWADWDPSQEVAIVMASRFDRSDTTTMISGRIDVPKIALAEMKVSITGRDKSASLTESKRNQNFTNQKSSDAAKTIAQDNGLNPVVSDTGDFSGKTYTSDTANLVVNRTDFEVLNVLAEREGYRWYVEGDDLIFEPKDTDNGTILVSYRPPDGNGGVADANCSDLTLGSNSTAARPHEVTYAGWHHGKKKLFKSVQTAPGKGDVVRYRFHHNGNTQAQLDTKAKARLKDLIRHELTITARMPGDLTVDPRMVVRVAGTGTIYDDPTYDPDSIEWTMGWETDFEMTIVAKSARAGRTQ